MLRAHRTTVVMRVRTGTCHGRQLCWGSMAGRWDGSLPPIAGAARAAGSWPAWLVSTELLMYGFARTQAAVVMGVLAGAAFGCTVAIAFVRARAQSEPVRLPSPRAEELRPPRARELALASGATLALLALQAIHDSTRHYDGSVGGDAFSFGATVAEAPILGISALVLCISSIALFLCASRVAALPSGVVEQGDAGPCVRVGETRYLLTSIPEGVSEGDRIAFLALEPSSGGTGP